MISDNEFKKERNKKIFEHNVDVLNKVEQALENLNKRKLNNVQEKLEEGKKLLLERIKVIKLADSEEQPDR